MIIKGFNRVELIVSEGEIERAVKQFNEVFGLNLPVPHPIANTPVLSATDFDGFIEIVAPLSEETSFAKKLSRGGPGQIGPLVWEVEDIDDAREWLAEHGYNIVFEYDSRKGNSMEVKYAVHQLILDPGQWFGFNVTMMKRFNVTS